MSSKVKVFLLYLFPFFISAFVLFDRPFFYFSPQDPRDANLYYEIDITAVFYICYAYFSVMFCYALLYATSFFRSKKVLFTLSFLLYFFSYVYVMHFTLAGFLIHYNSILAVFDSNVPEIKDFWSALSTGSILIALLLSILYCGAYIFLTRGVKTEDLRIQNRKKLAGGAFVFCLIGTVLLEKGSFFSNLEPFVLPVTSFVRYREEETNISKILSTIDSDLFSSVKSSVPKEEKETYVVVIGESASRDLHPLYSPDAVAPSPLKDEKLYVFDRIYAPAPITMLSLFQVFFINPEKGKTVDFIDLAKKAGFKTFWLSNQFRSGNVGDNPTAALSRRADVSEFINNANPDLKNYSDMPLDENLLPRFQEALADPAPKKVIFLHLFGSHAPYSRRFPPNMEIKSPNPDFENVVNKKARVAKQRDEVRSYAKSMYYTDTVLKKMIETLKAQSGYTTLLYFSDHGANPRASLNRNPKDKSILEVPFFLWASERYKDANARKLKNAAAAKDKLYKMDRLFFTLADWMNLSHPKLTIKKDSLFSPDLEETTEKEIQETPSVI